MILVVCYFEYALSMHVESLLDLLYLAAGIAFLGLALYLVHLTDGKHRFCYIDQLYRIIFMLYNKLPIVVYVNS